MSVLSWCEGDMAIKLRVVPGRGLLLTGMTGSDFEASGLWTRWYQALGEKDREAGGSSAHPL